MPCRARPRLNKTKVWSTKIGKKYTIALPGDLGLDWRLGQRVFFRIRGDAVVVSIAPTGLLGGRLVSTRVRFHRIVKRPLWRTQLTPWDSCRERQVDATPFVSATEDLALG